MNSILSASYNKSASKNEHSPIADKAEFAFIGRSNVGKSTIINLICRKKELAKTSAKPGKTQLMNYFDVVSGSKDGEEQSWYLVDLPGYGYAKASKSQRAERWDMISEYLLDKENLLHIFVLIDSRIKPQDIDLDFVNRIWREHKSFSLIFTKSDKVSQKEVSANVRAFFNELKKTMNTLPKQYITTCFKQFTIQPILEDIHEMSKGFVPSIIESDKKSETDSE